MFFFQGLDAPPLPTEDSVFSQAKARDPEFDPETVSIYDRANGAVALDTLVSQELRMIEWAMRVWKRSPLSAPKDTLIATFGTQETTPSDRAAAVFRFLIALANDQHGEVRYLESCRDVAVSLVLCYDDADRGGAGYGPDGVVTQGILDQYMTHLYARRDRFVKLFRESVKGVKREMTVDEFVAVVEALATEVDRVREKKAELQALQRQIKPLFDIAFLITRDPAAVPVHDRVNGGGKDGQGGDENGKNGDGENGDDDDNYSDFEFDDDPVAIAEAARQCRRDCDDPTGQWSLADGHHLLCGCKEYLAPYLEAEEWAIECVKRGRDGEKGEEGKKERNENEVEK